MEDLRVQSHEEGLKGVEAGDIFALVGRTGCSQTGSGPTGSWYASAIHGEYKPAQFLDTGAQQGGSLFSALDPGELPPALGTGTSFDGTRTAQVVDTGQNNPNGLFL